jgi:uncharacterized membrane protein YfcA
MNFKVFLRTLCFLVILFVMLYVGMYNTQNIKFNFPLISPKPIEQPGALVYFAVFAIGILGGTMFIGGGKSGGRSGGSKDK